MLMDVFSPRTEACLQLATLYHSDVQLMAGHHPFIDHVRAVTDQVRLYLGEESMAVPVAAFHDLLYDSLLTQDDLIAFLDCLYRNSRNRAESLAIAWRLLDEIHDPYYPQLPHVQSRDYSERVEDQPLYAKPLSEAAATIRLCCLSDNLSRLLGADPAIVGRRAVRILRDIPHQMPFLTGTNTYLYKQTERLYQALQAIYPVAALV